MSTLLSKESILEHFDAIEGYYWSESDKRNFIDNLIELGLETKYAL